ncbi:ABC transporter permease [Streptomyces sp. CC228A]|uniref:ABC transporter permease n=1 Tax=Streptomyces sp. CC228A TaxID=2898186 RepID=UPI001F25921F|nr:ABC transporter permease [Streptomyces sp. CC228A]
MSVLSPSGSGWVAVRQHRRALWAAGWLVAVAAAIPLTLRIWLAASPGEAACLAGDWHMCDARAFNGQMSITGLLWLAMEYADQSLLFLPALLGAFVAGPLVARELESGTYRLAWTQSVSPRRWLATRTAAAAAVAVVLSALLIGTFQLGGASVGFRSLAHWPERGTYESSGPVLVAYCLLGVAVGVLVGLLVRRTVPAMAVAGGASALVVLLFGSFRWDLWPHKVLSGAGTGREGGWASLPPDTFVLRSGYVTEDGARLPYDSCWDLQTGHDACPPELGVTSWFIEYHPPSAFWPVQLTETALILALAAAVAAAAFRVLRRHHA